MNLTFDGLGPDLVIPDTVVEDTAVTLGCFARLPTLLAPFELDLEVVVLIILDRSQTSELLTRDMDNAIFDFENALWIHPWIDAFFIVADVNIPPIEIFTIK